MSIPLGEPFEPDCCCAYCTQQAKKLFWLGALKSVAGIILTTAAAEALVLAAPAALGAAGFAAAGIRAGSIAARVQSVIGNVRQGSTFALMMSMGAKKTVTPGVAKGIRAAVHGAIEGVNKLKTVFADRERRLDPDEGNGPQITFEDDEIALAEMLEEFKRLGKVCRICEKRINPETAGLCVSVCPGHPEAANCLMIQEDDERTVK